MHETEADAIDKHEHRRSLRRTALWASLAALVVGLAFVAVWFQPQKLFIDETVDEDFPVALAGNDPAPTSTNPAPPAGASSDATPAAKAPTGSTPADQPAAPSSTAAVPAAEPRVVARGSFESIEHDTTGLALLIAQPDGSHVLRFEGLDTSNGPDLRVLLSPSAATEQAYEEGSLELGSLKGNQGNQNYLIPTGTNPSAFRSAVIWCERFSVAFGIADLAPL